MQPATTAGRVSQPRLSRRHRRAVRFRRAIGWRGVEVEAGATNDPGHGGGGLQHLAFALHQTLAPVQRAAQAGFQQDGMGSGKSRSVLIRKYISSIQGRDQVGAVARSEDGRMLSLIHISEPTRRS